MRGDLLGATQLWSSCSLDAKPGKLHESQQVVPHNQRMLGSGPGPAREDSTWRQPVAISLLEGVGKGKAGWLLFLLSLHLPKS